MHGEIAVHIIMQANYNFNVVAYIFACKHVSANQLSLE